jgi:hypothetical protein
MRSTNRFGRLDRESGLAGLEVALGVSMSKRSKEYERVKTGKKAEGYLGLMIRLKVQHRWEKAGGR